MGIEKARPAKVSKQALSDTTKKAQTAAVTAQDNKSPLKEECLPAQKVLVGFGYNYN